MRLLAGHSDGGSPLLFCALSHLETPDELCWFCFFFFFRGVWRVRVSGNSFDIVCARSGSVTTSNSENGAVPQLTASQHDAVLQLDITSVACADSR